MKKCSFPSCNNPATHYDPIDKDRICDEHLNWLRGLGINTVYRKLTYPVVDSQPGKPWSPCYGSTCTHPSHVRV
ncbi:MAG: hypothetical protein LLG05_03410 [Porphyromonadaceae bacterium]|nr:hypothetical protein [Porphyromonadaceae bacterium]